MEIEDPDKVVSLPVKFKDPVEVAERYLTLAEGTKCWHDRGVVVDIAKAEVECRVCHEKLNPIWALTQLAQKETHWHNMRARYAEEMARLAARSKTKCQHCKKLTRISNA